MKKCYTCKIKYPLFMFGINHMRYQIQSDQGKLIDCRICTCKRFIKQNGNVCKYNFSTKKFEVVILKVTLKNIIKQFLNK